MKEIEDLLRENREKLDRVKAPEEMENRLKNALDRKKTNKSWKRMAVVASLLFVFFFSYNYNALAFYGKRLLGYDGVMSQTLQDLNELGKGQEIGKSHTFENGVEIILDGVMVDESQLLAFYRIKYAQGNVDDSSFMITPVIKGFIKRYRPSSGQGEMNDEKTEITWIHSIEPPAFYEKTLRFEGNMELGGRWESFSIPFSLDRDKAMGHSIKQKMNKRITIENQEIRFDTILAAPTQTVIKGSLASTLNLAMEQLTGKQVRPVISFSLIANEEHLQPMGSGSSSSLRGIDFEYNFEALPPDLESLEIQIDELIIDQRVAQSIPLKREEGKKIEIAGQEIVIHKVEPRKGKTEITIESEENVLLTNINLIADGKTLPLEGMHSEEYTKTKDKGILKKRIIVFDGMGAELNLQVKGIHYSKDVNRRIEIPIK